MMINSQFLKNIGFSRSGDSSISNFSHIWDAPPSYIAGDDTKTQGNWVTSPKAPRNSCQRENKGHNLNPPHCRPSPPLAKTLGSGWVEARGLTVHQESAEMDCGTERMESLSLLLSQILEASWPSSAALLHYHFDSLAKSGLLVYRNCRWTYSWTFWEQGKKKSITRDIILHPIPSHL